MKTNICSLCHGAGNLICIHNEKREWWPCSACGGNGARITHGPAFFGPSVPQKQQERDQ